MLPNDQPLSKMGKMDQSDFTFGIKSRKGLSTNDVMFINTVLKKLPQLHVKLHGHKFIAFYHASVNFTAESPATSLVAQ